jgi:porin
MRRTATLLAVVFFAASAFAQEDKKTDDLKPADPDTGESTVEETTLGLLPQPFENRGVKFAATYIGEALGNASGGFKRGSVYEGRLNLAVDVDFEKLADVRDVTFHANMFQIHGGGLSRGALLNFMDVSGIEALPSTRLYEAWFERKWGTKLALRAGQLAADTEFMTAKYTDVFTNASLGWPAGLSLNLPSGGPSPPLAAVGARLRAEITDNLTVLGAVFNGDSAGPGADDPQLRNRYGVNFRVNDPPLVLGEAQFLWNGKKGDPGLDGKFKLGAWRHFGVFRDQRECPGSCGEISGFIRSLSKNYIASARTTTAASASSRERPTARPTETSSTITRTRGWNSSAWQIAGRRTSSALRPRTLTSRRVLRPLILTSRD